MYYRLPDTLVADLDAFGEKIKIYQRGDMSPVQFRGLRVVHGIYLQRVHETYMFRIRCPGGCVTPTQLRKVAELSLKYAAPEFHVTTRGELQLQYIILDDVITAAKELIKFGLSTRGGGGNTIRNITANHDSGVRKGEVFDVAPYATELTSRMVSETDTWDLPRKFKVGFTSLEGEDEARVTITCVGFVAKIKDGKQGFKVLVGGGQGPLPKLGKVLFEWVEADKVYYIVKAMKLLFDKYGNRRNKHKNRFKFLYEKLGEEKFNTIFTEYYEELLKTPGLELKIEERPNVEGVSADLKLEKPKDSAKFENWKKRYVISQKQEGLNMVVIPLNCGDIKNMDGVHLADFLDQFGENSIRLTIEQNICLKNIPNRFLGTVFNFLCGLRSLSHMPEFFGRMITCTGAATCSLGICLSRGVTEVIREKLLENGMDMDAFRDTKLYISGCSNACGCHSLADLGFFGRVASVEHNMFPNYAVLAGAYLDERGSNVAEKLGEIAAKHLPQFVVEVFTAYLQNKSDFESCPKFLRSQFGHKEIERLCEKYKEEIPKLEEDESFYHDYNEIKRFSILKGQKSECSAGLFDMIDVDFSAIDTLRKGFKEGTIDEQKKGEAYYRMVLHASRSLLVTQGLEAGSDKEVFKDFVEHFLAKKLVPEKFRTLISEADQKQLDRLETRREEVFELGETMYKLYLSMDDSLRFNLETKTSEESKEAGKVVEDMTAKTDVVKDLTGVKCPMNFVKTKMALAPMKSGQKLEIYLDAGEPMANVPDSVRLEGHSILHEKERDDGSWSVLITKDGKSLESSEMSVETTKEGVNGEENKPDLIKDFTGVKCPMNFVKTKMALAPMKSGELLEIYLDDGAPKENVPASTRLEGHEILWEKQREDSSWSVLIKKA